MPARIPPHPATPPPIPSAAPRPPLSPRPLRPTRRPAPLIPSATRPLPAPAAPQPPSQNHPPSPRPPLSTRRRAFPGAPPAPFAPANCANVLDAFTDALRDLPGKVRDRVTTATAEALAEAALRTGMSGLARELDSLLPDDSPDWYYFGLVPPAKAEPPAAPTHIEAQPSGPSRAILGCDRSPRGQKYRFAIKVEGRDPDWLEQPLTSEPQLVLESLPATGRLHARVAAHNAAGDSPWSPATTLPLA